MKKILALTLLLALLVVPGVTAGADSSLIEEITYKDNGVVEVDFFGRVRYGKGFAIAVEDENGNAYKVKVKKRDNDEVRFSVKGYVKDMEYTFTITKIRPRREDAYIDQTGAFSIPAPGVVAIRSIDSDATDREVDVEFVTKVRWQKPTAYVVDALSNVRTEGRITDRDKNDCEIRFPAGTLVAGNNYELTITGVGARDGEIAQISQTFTARP